MRNKGTKNYAFLFFITNFMIIKSKKSLLNKPRLS